MRNDKLLARTGAALLLAVVAFAAHALPPLEEEVVNASEVVFEGGKAYVDAGGGRLEALHSRRQGGETVYYRLVRYDNEFGYVGDDGATTVAQTGSQYSGLGPTPYRYFGSGHFARPDFYNSPYNRDARQRYWGPGYMGSCSRYDGCREVQFLPFLPYYRAGY